MASQKGRASGIFTAPRQHPY